MVAITIENISKNYCNIITKHVGTGLECSYHDKHDFRQFHDLDTAKRGITPAPASEKNPRNLRFPDRLRVGNTFVNPTAMPAWTFSRAGATPYWV